MWGAKNILYAALWVSLFLSLKLKYVYWYFIVLLDLQCQTWIATLPKEYKYFLNLIFRLQSAHV